MKGEEPEMRYIAIEEAFSIPELAERQSSPWPPNRFSQLHLADWGRRLPDFDYPYEPGHEAVAGLERTTLGDADRHKIAHGNAERILRL